MNVNPPPYPSVIRKSVEDLSDQKDKVSQRSQYRQIVGVAGYVNGVVTRRYHDLSTDAGITPVAATGVDTVASTLIHDIYQFQDSSDTGPHGHGLLIYKRWMTPIVFSRP